MSKKIPLSNVYGNLTPYFLELARDGDILSLEIDASFAGRHVQEEMPVEDFQRLLDSSTKYEELLGLTFESTEDDIQGTIGIGSGNERFVIKKADVDLS